MAEAQYAWQHLTLVAAGDATLPPKDDKPEKHFLKCMTMEAVEYSVWDDKLWPFIKDNLNSSIWCVVKNPSAKFKSIVKAQVEEPSEEQKSNPSAGLQQWRGGGRGGGGKSPEEQRRISHMNALTSAIATIVPLVQIGKLPIPEGKTEPKDIVRWIRTQVYACEDAYFTYIWESAKDTPKSDIKPEPKPADPQQAIAGDPGPEYDDRPVE